MYIWRRRRRRGSFPGIVVVGGEVGGGGRVRNHVRIDGNEQGRRKRMKYLDKGILRGGEGEGGEDGDCGGGVREKEDFRLSGCR